MAARGGRIVSTVFTADNSGCACSKDSCIGCPTYEKNRTPLKHYDLLRAMSAEEFAGWIAEHIDCFNCPNPRNGCSENDDTCAAAWLDWLMKEEE